MVETKKVKDWGTLAIYSGIGVYFLIYLLVRVWNEVKPEASQISSMLFGTACLGCSVMIVCGILLKVPGASSTAMGLKIVAGLIMLPIAFIALIYLPYFIPFSNNDRPTKLDFTLFGLIILFALTFLISAGIKIRNLRG